MKSPALFKEYIWLITTIYRAGKISLAEINEKWVDSELSEGIEMARATFNRHKDAIQDMFGIFIECDRKDGFRYYIGNDEVLRENTVQNWMLSTLTVNNIISESMPLKDRILLEPIATDDVYLKTMIEAMRNGVKVEMVYQRYTSDKPKTLKVEPYALKLFAQRWYVLGNLHYDATETKPVWDCLATFAFDRIKEIKLTKEKYKVKKDFDASAFFANYYGITTDNETLSKVVIRAMGYERFYMRDLPLHHTQKEIASGEDYIDFQLMICPTYDFINRLLSSGSAIKVLEPQWLADKIRDEHRKAAEMYDL